MSTIEFYNQHSQSFFDTTVNADVSELYQPFIECLQQNARILDAGCGSGRDSKAFIEMGFTVTAIDASSELASAAAKFIGQPVLVCRFDEIDKTNQFDGIWACASLLHVEANALPSTFATLASTLVANGVFYCSFKYGVQERTHNGRSFTDANESLLQQWIQGSGLHIKQTWVTTDVRPGRENEKWLNAILIKTSK
ncbi:class I SAM-dependent DNA methyltransferase [Shewanella metallivivens]|jgi:SAM-dependent methyltransferase|uniref:Methyltransferase domain-containing protein n=1 Tax=Shewanella metallivivens TaxID=2872342 RepID=A0ABT5TJ01_9GAMM|nr:class I SAM-dependent methyltransferase [Shewanella metallivivens]MDD8058427.1 methyltransferase domain-containing protein [Shewanella metallivivens]